MGEERRDGDGERERGKDREARDKGSRQAGAHTDTHGLKGSMRQKACDDGVGG